jgi:hypothetical protein
MTIWYIFSVFGIMYQEKSGNPGHLLLYIRILTHLTYTILLRFSFDHRDTFNLGDLFCASFGRFVDFGRFLVDFAPVLVDL